MCINLLSKRQIALTIKKKTLTDRISACDIEVDKAGDNNNDDDDDDDDKSCYDSSRNPVFSSFLY